MIELFEKVTGHKFIKSNYNQINKDVETAINLELEKILVN